MASAVDPAYGVKWDVYTHRRGAHGPGWPEPSQGPAQALDFSTRLDLDMNYGSGLD